MHMAKDSEEVSDRDHLDLIVALVLHAHAPRKPERQCPIFLASVLLLCVVCCVVVVIAVVVVVVVAVEVAAVAVVVVVVVVVVDVLDVVDVVCFVLFRTRSFSKCTCQHQLRINWHATGAGANSRRFQHPRALGHRQLLIIEAPLS